MIDELRVRDLGVIADLDVVLESGLTVITGETGAGKTLVVEALELVLGGRSDATLVRSGAAEAIVEARFSIDDEEVVVSRVQPRAGRSRATINSQMVPAAALEECARDFVDLYGQHVHQSLLRPATQRAALDAFAAVDLAPLEELRAALRGVAEEIDSLGGDPAARLRELDICRYELDEITAAQITNPAEEELLLEEEEVLGRADALRDAANLAHDALVGAEGRGAIDRLGDALNALGHADTLGAHAKRLRSLLVELEDTADEIRRDAERFEADPERLIEVQARRQLLRRLVHKHGSSLSDVIDARARLTGRIEQLASTEERTAELREKAAELTASLRREEQVVGDARRSGATPLAKAVEECFSELGLTRARFSVALAAEGFADDVEFLLAANVGEPFAPLSKVASGGELARVMLALRLVLSSAPPTLIFDEVDAGIGGQAALAVGAALARLATAHQVLVVTHLAQVAAFGDHHLVVDKAEIGERTVATVREVIGDERVVELSRMLSGHPESTAAQRHAEELLHGAARAK